jgi:O-antigen ligase/polysaccharide polymerase Wzy-like membrane protein
MRRAVRTLNRGWLLPVAAAVLVLLSVAGAFGTVSERAKETVRKPPHAPSGPRAFFVQTYPPERGPYDHRWQWARTKSSVVVHGRGTYWLAFRARSYRAPRTLTLSRLGSGHRGGGQRSLIVGRVRVRRRQAPVVLGPFTVRGKTTLRLTAKPRARPVPGKRDKRRLAVQLSSPSLARGPAAALPGKGFYAADETAFGIYQWLGRSGAIDVVAPPHARRAWLGFVGFSFESTLRRLRIRALGSARVRATTLGLQRRVTIGSFPLKRGRATLLVRPRPGPSEESKPVGARPLSVSAAYLVASTRPIPEPKPPDLRGSAASRAGILAAMVAVLFCVALLITRRQNLALIVLLAATAPLEVYKTPGFLGVNVSLFRVALVVAGVAVLLRHRSDAISALRKPQVLGFVAMAGLMVLSLALLSDNTFLGKRVVAQVCGGIAAAVVIAALAAREPLERVVGAFLLGAVLPIGFVAVQSLLLANGVDFTPPLLEYLPPAPGLETTRAHVVLPPPGEEVRAKGVFDHPNGFGLYLMMVLVLCAGLAAARLVRKEGMTRVLPPAALGAAAAVTLAATLSRTALVTALIALLAFSWPAAHLYKRFPSHRAVRLAAVLGLVALAGFVPLALGAGERFNPAVAVNKGANNIRVQLGEIAWREYKQHPVTGLGLGDLGARLGQHQRISQADSTWLTMAAELGTTGILSLLLVTLLVVLPLGSLVRARRGSPAALLPGAVLGAYLGFAVGNGFNNFWWSDFHWVLLGVVLVTLRWRRAESQRVKRSALQIWSTMSRRLTRGAKAPMTSSTSS